MKKENILFAVIGLFIGFFGGFFLANNLNRNAVSQTDAAQSAPAAPFQNPQTQAVDIKESQKQAAMMPEIAQTLETADKEPDNFGAQIKAGDMYAKIQKFDEAVEFYEKASRIKPDDYDTIIKIGNTYFDSKQFDKARKWYLLALEKKPEDINVRTDLGITFVEGESPDLNRAIKELQIALQTNPTYEPTLYNLGVAYFKKNEL
ncbi:MAG TPA: tetratricopeptide repeat protein, partial [Pyrinomonadaceae bacterium]|nr:tetratricopeptide repeat protein [Pyrinomonadaceae bacterium]